MKACNKPAVIGRARTSKKHVQYLFVVMLHLSEPRQMGKWGLKCQSTPPVFRRRTRNNCPNNDDIVQRSLHAVAVIFQSTSFIGRRGGFLSLSIDRRGEKSMVSSHRTKVTRSKPPQTRVKRPSDHKIEWEVYRLVRLPLAGG